MSIWNGHQRRFLWGTVPNLMENQSCLIRCVTKKCHRYVEKSEEHFQYTHGKDVHRLNTNFGLGLPSLPSLLI